MTFKRKNIPEHPEICFVILKYIIDFMGNKPSIEDQGGHYRKSLCFEADVKDVSCFTSSKCLNVSPVRY